MQTSRKDMTIMIISHQERILNIADEIILLSNGKVEKQGLKNDILPAITGTESAIHPCDKIM